MEVPISNRDNKRARPRFINVGGVEGLLVLGGSLAIAGFMALFTIKPRKSSQPRLDHNIHEITHTPIADHDDDDNGLVENLQLPSEKEGFQLVLDNHIDELQGKNLDLREESISSQVSSLVSEGVTEAAAKQGKVEDEEEEEEDECQHEILVLSDDSTPPESVVSCDEDYTESTDLSLDEEEDKDQTYKEEEEEEEEVVDQGNHLNNVESSEDDDSEEVTERSSSLSSLVMEELAAPTYAKEFGDTDPNYERIAKEENSFNSLGLGQQQKKFDVSGMFGSRAHLPPLGVGSNEMVSVASPTKAQLWLMVLPVVMLTLLLALIHFFVIDNYVLDMEF